MMGAYSSGTFFAVQAAAGISQAPAEVIEHSVLTFTSPAYAGLGNVHVTSNNSKYSAFWLMMS